jgi:hypothetical protein
MRQPGLAECIIFVIYTVGVISIARDAVMRRSELSPVSYAIRLYGAGFLAVMALAGIGLRVWVALR